MSSIYEALGATDGPVTRSWTRTDVLLYALGVGAGQTDPLGELAYTTENTRGIGQQVLPTFATIIGSGFVSALGKLDLAKMVHGEQVVTLHGSFPTSGTLEATSEVVGVYDKGTAAVVEIETRSVLAATQAPLCTTRSSLFIRGEGGWGGDRGPSPRSADLRPDRTPDEIVTYSVPVDQALLYRLSGDRNPLHSDPQLAKKAGFDRPILHGLCTFGYTARAILHAVFGSDAAKFSAMSGRFKAPVLPGDTLSVRIWVDGADVVYETRKQDEAVVLSGTAAGAGTN